MLGAALLLTLAAGDVQQTAPRGGPAVAVDVHPLALLGAGLGAIAVESVFVDVPLAVTLQVNDRTALTVELGATYLKAMQFSAGWTFNASVGPTFFSGPDAFSGWFVTPKLGFFMGLAAAKPVVILNDVNDGPLDPGGGIGRAFTAGFDAGYQWRRGHVHVAIMGGLSAGYGWATPELLTPLWMELAPGTSKRQGFVWSANLNALRFGLAF